MVAMGGEEGNWRGESETDCERAGCCLRGGVEGRITGVLGAVAVVETPESVKRGDPILDRLGESTWASGGDRMTDDDTSSIVGGAGGDE